MRLLFSTALLILFFVITFRYSTVGLPKADHFWFMGERANASGEWDYFVKMLSFNRTRVNAPGDYGLFRPGTTGTLALLDIFARDNYYVSGVASLIFHALVCGGLFMVAWRGSGSSWMATAITAAFLACFAGYRAVGWRHISPYLLCGFFLTLTVWLAMRRRFALATVTLFGATLFHELAYYVAIAGALLVVIASKNSAWKERIKRAAWLWAPALGCFILNRWSLFAFPVPSKPFYHVHLSDRMVYDYFSIAGHFALAFLFPFLGRFSPVSEDSLWWHDDRWSFAITSEWTIFIAGILMTAAFLLVLYLGIRRLRAGSARAIPGVAGALLFVVLAFGLASGRTAGKMAPAEYLSTGSYYFYLSALALFLALVSILPWLGKKGRIALAVFLAAQAVVSSYLIRETARPWYGSDVALASMTLKIKSELEKIPGGCLVGFQGTGLLAALPDLIEWRKGCGNEREKSVALCLVEKHQEIEVRGGTRDERTVYPRFDCANLPDLEGMAYFSLPELSEVSSRYQAFPRRR